MNSNFIETFLAFLRLGCTSFGGPVAHLGYLREEFVVRRRWLAERAYADLVALCQFLPGPASSQVGMAIGLSRAGIPGALAAWLGFTLPSALILIALAVGISHANLPSEILHALKTAAVAVVAHAVWGMARRMCNGGVTAAICLVTAAAVAYSPSAMVQLSMLAVAGFIGWIATKTPGDLPGSSLPVAISRRTGFVSLALFALLLVVLPLWAHSSGRPEIWLFDVFYRAGALVFGGGHVVLPLLQAELVGPGGVAAETFMVGYGATQAVPGPLFSFAAYLGAVDPRGGGVAFGAIVGLVGAFLPSLLLVIGALPFWEGLRHHPSVRRATVGINAAVVGLLLAALYHPVATSAIFGLFDVAVATAGFVLMTIRSAPSWAIVISTIAVYSLRMLSAG